MSYLRKRPRQARSQATLEAIVEATARILSEDGERALTTNRIAERAGVSVGSLYQYFPDRKAIVRALLEREGRRAEARRPAVIDDESAPRVQRLRALVDWHFEVHGDEPALTRALATLAGQVLPEDEMQRFAGLRRWRTARTLASLGSSAAVDAEAALFVVETCLDALCDRALRDCPERLRSETLRAEVTALLDRYLSR